MNNPIAIFKENWQQAKSLNDGNAAYCSLATVSSSGYPSIRTLVLRDVSDESFVIFINETSSKWQDLQHSQKCELLVFWPTLLQQYRIRGEYSEISETEIQLNWQKKPYDSKILDHYYQQYHAQTSIIQTRDELLAGINQLKERYPKGTDIPFPGNAKGIAIKANYIEVWHNSAHDRLHQRQLYQLDGDCWQQQILVP